MHSNTTPALTPAAPGSLRLTKGTVLAEDGRPARQNSRTVLLSSSVKSKDSDKDVAVDVELAPPAAAADSQVEGPDGEGPGVLDEEEQSEVREGSEEGRGVVLGEVWRGRRGAGRRLRAGFVGGCSRVLGG